MSVVGKQTSSMYWNIPMLSAKKHEKDKDPWGGVSSELRENQAAKVK